MSKSSKSDILISLIKEIIKSEVRNAKTELKEEIMHILKTNKSSVPTNRVVTNVPAKLKENVTKSDSNRKLATTTLNNKKQFTKNPILNEILNSTTPFNSSQRADPTSMLSESSVLDMIKRDSDDDWGTIKLNSNTMQYDAAPPTKQSKDTQDATGNSALDAVSKALNRDYTSLVNHPKFK